MSRFPRPFVGDAHLWSTIETEAGAIALKPIRATDLYFDIARSNHLPRNLPEGEHGSRVLDIGGGVKIRATGHVARGANGWEITGLYASQYPNGRDLTRLQDQRAREVILAMVLGWISTHEGDLAQADDIDRNNAAQTLEEQIKRHQDALRILRKQLRRCEEGKPFETYPDLPTKR